MQQAMQTEYPTSPGGGFQTNTVYIHLGVNLNSGNDLVEQLNDAVDKFYNLDGLKLPEQSITVNRKPKAWMKGEYNGKPVDIELIRQPHHEEWLLKTSSKLGLSHSELDDLAYTLFDAIAKPKAERDSDKHQLRCRY